VQNPEMLDPTTYFRLYLIVSGNLAWHFAAAKL